MTRVGWRVHALGKVSPSGLRRPLEALAGAVLGAARVVAAADSKLMVVDRGELMDRLADYRARSSAAPHVAQAAADLEQELAAFDRLPERRRSLAEDVSLLDNGLESLELRLRSAPRAGPAPALLEELDDLRSRLAQAAQLLEETITAAPAARPIPTGRLHRTRRRGIFRVGGSFVVLEADEHGVKRPKVAASLAEAIQLRDVLRAARRHGVGPLTWHVPTGWEDKSSGSGGA